MATAPIQPNPMLIFQTLNAYQQTAALKAAIELDLFTAIARGNTTAAQIAKKVSATERGVRILANHLVILGLLTKQGVDYGLTPDSATFLDKESPAYLGGALRFLGGDTQLESFRRLTDAVRKGGTAVSKEGIVSDNNAVWVDFARGMMPLMAPAADFIADLLASRLSARPTTVLDIAAGHGMFGISIARKSPQTTITAMDWEPVLEVARENAGKFGVADRHRTKPGSAFEVDFGSGYDVVLLTNFLHHFDQATCESLLRKTRAALKPDGCAVILEFVPNDDRVSPPPSATFALIMLAETRAGDAYTFRELDSMCRSAGFARTELHTVPPGVQSVVLATP